MRLCTPLPTLMVAAAIACGRSDAPTAPRSQALRQIAPTANSPCTVHWATGVSGNWTDATKWNPQGVPGASSSVCIDAAGTYAVSLDPVDDAVPVAVLALTVGGANAVPTLNLNGTLVTLNVQEGIDILSGAKVDLRNFTGATITAGNTFTNAGTLAATALCGSCGQQNVINADLLNQGTLTSAAILTLGKVNGAYQNTGTIDMTTNGQVVIPASAGSPTFAQDGGVVTSAGNFTTLTMFAGTYTANGGELRQRNPSNPKPIVVLDGANLVLGANTSQAVIGVKGSAGTAPTITGDIPALTTLWLAGPTSSVGTIAFSGNPTNAGTIIPVYAIDGNIGTLTLAGSGRLTNNGSILQSRSSGSAVTFHYQVDVTNNGTISTTDGTHIAFDKAGGSYENNGSIALGASSSVMQLRIIGSTLMHSGVSIDGGSVIIDAGGRLLGTGPITSHVQATNGGKVEPGQSPGIMSVRSFRPTATGVLRIELGGIAPGAEYDQLHATLTSGGVGSLATLAGTLDVAEVNGFQAGLCGQVFDVLVHSMASGYGTFATVNGLTPAAGRAMRVVYVNATAGNPGTGRVRLVGYDATAAVCVGPNPVALSEGALGTQYAVLLNHAPSASVTVTAQPDAQVTVSPAQLVFTTANWQQPQFITVTAVDDVLQEGPHTGSVTHAVVSTDASFAGFVPASLTANITDNDVNNPPIAGNDATTTVEETPVTISVLANDSDPEGATLTVTGVTAAGHGGVQILAGGTSVKYTPALNFSGSDQFSYTVSDGQATSTATVSVTVTPVNDVPVAADDQAVTRPARVTVLPVLANDTDADGDPLTVTQVTTPGHGTVVIDAGAQSVTYQSVSGYVGTDAFTYTISDGAGGTDVATVFLDIVTGNTAPIAAPDAASLKSYTGYVKIPVLQNDSDPEGDKIQLIGVSTPSYGTATISGHFIVYTIGLSTAGNDLFTYTIQDSFGATSTGVVTVTWPLPPPPPPPSPPPTMVGTSAKTRSVDFGGLPFCNYTVWFEKTTITLEVTNGGTGSITTTMTEKGLRGCTQPTLGPSLFQYNTNAVSVQGSQVTATFVNAPTNNPQGYAHFTGTLSSDGRTLKGTLTFFRTDQAPSTNLNWVVSESITLREQ